MTSRAPDSGSSAWIGERTPPPVMTLDRWLSGESPGGATESGAPLEPLARAGVAALDRALERPGRVRDSAFHLLAADALLTYACEAALESGQAEDRISWILDTILGR